MPRPRAAAEEPAPSPEGPQLGDREARRPPARTPRARARTERPGAPSGVARAGDAGPHGAGSASGGKGAASFEAALCGARRALG